jgi:hypothetical protein
VISPFRGDVVLTGFVLAIPVFLLAMRGEFTAQEVLTRLLWCLGAGWAAVTVVRLASTPPAPKNSPRTADGSTGADVDEDAAPAT